MNGLSFQFQNGVIREQLMLDSQEVSLRRLRQEAVHFVNKHHPKQPFGDLLADHILLYRHDFRSVNILELVQSAEEVTEGCLMEIVISPCPQHERLVVHPHTLFVHSYKTPTFCDFCGELLFGLVKQGLKCQGCGLNYHKRCASKIPNNCSGSRQRRPSAIPLSPRNSMSIQPVVSPAAIFPLTPVNGGLLTFPLSLGDVFSSSASAPANCASCSSRLGALTPTSTATTFVASLASSGSGGADGSGQQQHGGQGGTAAGAGPAICVTGDRALDEGDPIGGNYLQMPRKDRSSSWSGRPLWMEIAEAIRIKVPHTFQVHSYKRPTVCQHCKKLLKGLIRQGIQCRDCKYNCHKKCAQFVAKDCAGCLPYDHHHGGALSGGAGGEYHHRASSICGGAGAGERQQSAEERPSSAMLSSPGDCSSALEHRLRWMKSEPYDESDEGSITEENVLNDDHQQTNNNNSSAAHHLWPKQRAQATPSAPLSAANCSSRRDKENSSKNKTNAAGGITSEQQQKRGHGNEEEEEEEDDLLPDGTTTAKESQNIPLMRIVMSKKQTKRPTHARVLREGWMVHYTDRHSMRKKHFWRLDPKGITMFKDESASGYYKEIPLSEVLDVKDAAGDHFHQQQQQKDKGDQQQQEGGHPELIKTPTHFFEIRTQTSTYFIAGTPQPEDIGTSSTNAASGTTSEKEKQQQRRYSAAAAAAAANAAQWAQAIRQALMPVTPQSSGAPSIGGGGGGRENNRSHRRGTTTEGAGPENKEQLKVPAGGLATGTNEQGQQIGHLGAHIQSEQEFSQLYQIFAEEVLGSGQFGTVYGGIQRKSGKHVAVKLIDKLKFPSNKEAALRTEVEILQKVRHPGVVEFQQMLETPDRIFVVMEKLKGDMLEMILSSERGRLSERITQFLVHQILIALQYLHNQNIVHCDLKPENILLTSESDFPQVKLCDFGFARIIGERSFRRSVVGTPAYLAPEVLRNKGFNRSLDMWSVGVIVYVSLSGTFPFNEDEDINDQIQNAEFMYPPNPWKEVSAEAIEFINCLLQVKMSKRLTVAKALAHIWIQSYQLWSDLRLLEKEVGERFLTHPSDDQRWRDHERENGIKPAY